MRRFVVLGVVAVALAALVAAGCGWDDGVDSRAATAGLPSPRADVEARDWALDPADSSVSVPEETPVTLSVSGDEVSGAAPCNTYRGTVDWGYDGSVDVSGVAVTQMACEGPVLDAEAAFLAALQHVDHAEVDVDDDGRDDRDRLTLTGDGDTRLVFRSYDARDALVREWVVTGALTNDAMVSVAAEREPTLTMAEDGTLAVDSGCNIGEGEWELDGDELAVDGVSLEERACAPPEVMEQEAAIVGALDAATRVEATPRSLSILDADGQVVLTAAPA